MRSFIAPSCGMFLSSFLIIVGLFFILIFPSIFQYFVKKEFQLSPTSQSFKHWKKSPFPLSLDIYLFNWTNPQELGINKPKFTELGPYHFSEIREKSNLTWNDNGTISYRQSKTWYFQPDKSNGSLDDVVTSINAVTLTAAYNNRHSGYFQQKSVNMAFAFMKQQVWETHTARELLFDGYYNELMSLAYKLSPSLTSMSSPFDKFAWFYKFNGSFDQSGWFNLDTGVNDISTLGTLREWNHNNHTNFFPGRCGQVEGYSGDVFPPNLMTRDSKFKIFSTDLCRSMPFVYARDATMHGIQGLQYQAVLRRDQADLEDSEDKETCCGGECVPGGFFNLTSCRYGAPVFVSFPHFFGSKQFYRNLVEGLHPDPAKHRFYLTLEPTYGIPIDVGVRVQLNMLLQPIPHISMYKSAPRLMFPALWVDQKARITEALAKELHLVIILPTIALVTGVVTLSSGTLLFLGLLFLRARTKQKEKKMEVVSTGSLEKITPLTTLKS